MRELKYPNIQLLNATNVVLQLMKVTHNDANYLIETTTNRLTKLLQSASKIGIQQLKI